MQESAPQTPSGMRLTRPPSAGHFEPALNHPSAEDKSVRNRTTQSVQAPSPFRPEDNQFQLISEVQMTLSGFGPTQTLSLLWGNLVPLVSLATSKPAA